MTHYTYVIDRYLLDKMGRALQPAEQVRFITGLELSDGVIVLQHPLTLKPRRASRTQPPTPQASREHKNTSGRSGSNSTHSSTATPAATPEQHTHQRPTSKPPVDGRTAAHSSARSSATTDATSDSSTTNKKARSPSMEHTTDNSTITCSNSTTLACKPPRNRLVSATDRQELLPWWNQDVISKAKILLVGAGGLGSTIALQLTQQGIGRLDIVDHDRVDTTNRSRQFYTARDVGHYKAHALPQRLRPFATAPTIIRGYASTIQEADLDDDYRIIIAGVDNSQANIAAAAKGLRDQTPVVFVNVSKDGEACRVFIQNPGGACYACYRPHSLIPSPPAPCTPTPAIVDILHIATGLAVRAATTLLHGETIGDYNCRDLTMTGTDITKTVERRPRCLLCDNDCLG